MTNPYLEHPNEEALERFLLHRSQDQELEVLETHILACEACVTRLESLETELVTLKEALADFEAERIQKELNSAQPFWKSWFTIPTLSWAGAAVAALAIGVAVVPHSVPHTYELSSSRGAEITTLPEGKPLDLKMETADIPQGPVNVQVVDASGEQVWNGRAAVNSEQAEINVPEISKPGTYFLRFYSTDSTDHELLREFRFEVK